MTKIRNEYVLSQKENNQLKIDLEKMKNYFENLPNFLENPIIDNQYKILIKKENNFIMTIMKIVKKAILMLQKFEDVQKVKKM